MNFAPFKLSMETRQVPNTKWKIIIESDYVPSTNYRMYLFYLEP